MTTLPARLAIAPQQARCPGEYIIDTSGNGLIELGHPASGGVASETLVLKFALPRSTTINKGSRLDGINVAYNVGTNPLTNIGAVLTSKTYTPTPVGPTTIVTTNSFPLSLGDKMGTMNVAAPAFDQTANPIMYELALTFTNTNAYPNQVTIITLYTIEILYTNDFTA